MAGLYYYVPIEKINDIIDCGLKLSDWCDREITLPGLTVSKKVLKALLNPRDDEKKLGDGSYRCLRLEVDLEYCRVGDSDLYLMGLKEPELMKKYLETIVPLGSYRFGTFRKPEVLVSASVLSENIEVTGRAMDIPILYESSEKLYLNNLMEKHEELYQDSGNHLLYAFALLSESKGRLVKYEDKERKLTIFIDRNNSEYTVLTNPEGGN